MRAKPRGESAVQKSVRARVRSINTDAFFCADGGMNADRLHLLQLNPANYYSVPQIQEMLLQERIAGISFNSEDEDEDQDYEDEDDDLVAQSTFAMLPADEDEEGDEDEMEEEEEDEEDDEQDEIDDKDTEKEVKLSAAKGRAKSVKELRERMQARLTELRGKRATGEAPVDDDDDDMAVESDEDDRKAAIENKHKNKTSNKSKEDKEKMKEKKKEKKKEKPPKKKARKEPKEEKKEAPVRNGVAVPPPAKKPASENGDSGKKQKKQKADKSDALEFNEMEFTSDVPVPTYLEKKRKHENRKKLLEKVPTQPIHVWNGVLKSLDECCTGQEAEARGS